MSNSDEEVKEFHADAARLVAAQIANEDNATGDQGERAIGKRVKKMAEGLAHTWYGDTES